MFTDRSSVLSGSECSLDAVDHSPAVKLNDAGLEDASAGFPSKRVERRKESTGARVQVVEEVFDDDRRRKSRQRSQADSQSKREINEADNSEATYKTLKSIFAEYEVDKGKGVMLGLVHKIFSGIGVGVSNEEVLELFREVNISDSRTDLSLISMSAGQDVNTRGSLGGTIAIAGHIIAHGFDSLFRSFDRETEVQRAMKTLFVSFDVFIAMFELWQSAAQFRMFERRHPLQGQHIAEVSSTRELIRPDGVWIFLYEAVLMCSAVVFAICVLAVHIYPIDVLPWYFAVLTPYEVLITVLFLVDVFVHSSTAIVSPTSEGSVAVVDNASEGFHQRLKFWFWIDVLAMIPIRFLFSAGGTTNKSAFELAALGNLTSTDAGCVTMCNNNHEFQASVVAAKALIHLRLLKLLRCFLDSFHESGLAAISEWHIKSYYVVAEGLKTVSQLVLLLVTYATILISLGIPHGDSIAGGTYTILTMFSTAGFGDIVPVTQGQRIFFCVVFITSSVLNGVIIGNFVNFFQASDMASRHGGALLEMDAVLSFFRIPEPLHIEVIEYYSHTITMDVLTTYHHLVVGLPSEMQFGLQLWSQLRHIRSLPYFDDLHKSARLFLCKALLKATYCPEEFVVYFGEIGEEMFFLSHGFVDVCTQDFELIATLRPGQYFGEMAIMSSKPQRRGASVKCITYTEMFILKKEDFASVLERSPKLRRAVNEVIESRKSLSMVANPAVEKNSLPEKPEAAVDPDVSFARDDWPAVASNDERDISHMEVPVVPGNLMSNSNNSIDDAKSPQESERRSRVSTRHSSPMNATPPLRDPPNSRPPRLKADVSDSFFVDAPDLCSPNDPALQASSRQGDHPKVSLANRKVEAMMARSLAQPQLMGMSVGPPKDSWLTFPSLFPLASSTVSARHLTNATAVRSHGVLHPSSHKTPQFDSPSGDYEASLHQYAEHSSNTASGSGASALNDSSSTAEQMEEIVTIVESALQEVHATQVEFQRLIAAILDDKRDLLTDPLQNDRQIVT